MITPTSQEEFFDARTIRKLSQASGAVWIFTHATFHVLGTVFQGLRNPEFHGVYNTLISFLLSQVIVFTFSYKKISNSVFKGALLTMLNGLLIYITVNGVQTVYGHMDGNTDSKSKTGKILYFIDPSPWLPSATMNAEMDTVRRENQELEAKIAVLRSEATRGASQFDSIQIIVIPTAISGSFYEADIIVAATHTDLDVKAWANKTPFEMQNGKGHIKVPIDRNASRSNTRQSVYLEVLFDSVQYQRDISFSRKLSEKPIPMTYTLPKTLYFGCKNEINVSLPKNGCKPHVTGAKIVSMDKPGILVLVPSASNVVLSINCKGVQRELKFDAKSPPSPRIAVMLGNSEVDLKEGIPLTSIGDLEVKIKAEEKFSQMYPEDIQYYIGLVEAYIARRTMAIAHVNEVSGKDLRNLRAMARHGDDLVIDVTEVYRINYNGQHEKIRLQNAVVKIPIK